MGKSVMIWEGMGRDEMRVQDMHMIVIGMWVGWCRTEADEMNFGCLSDRFGTCTHTNRRLEIGDRRLEMERLESRENSNLGYADMFGSMNILEAVGCRCRIRYVIEGSPLSLPTVPYHSSQVATPFDDALSTTLSPVSGKKILETPTLPSLICPTLLYSPNSGLGPMKTP